MASKAPPNVETDKVLPGWLFVWSLHCRLDAPGGVATVLRELAQSQLTAADYRPVLLSASWERLQSTNLPTPLDRCRWRRLNPPLIRGKGIRAPVGALLKLPLTILWLRKLLREEHIGVVNFHYPGLECFVFALMRRCGLFRGKLILSFHGTDLGNVETSRGLERILWRLILRSSDLITAVSRDQRERLQVEVGPTQVPLVTVYGGAALDSFYGREPPALLAKLPADRPVILSVASFIPRKRPRLALAAFGEILRQRPDAVLILIGAEGSELPLVEASLTADNYSNVHLIVNLPHEKLGWFYGRASILLHTAALEPLGLVLLEAGLYAVPTVATDVGGIPDIIRDDVSGRLFPCDSSPEVIAKICLELLESPRRAEQLGQQLQTTVAEEFTWAAVMQRYYNGIRR